ncbi:expressed unknown protein [Seminavis robusta]|uniref:PH domain-containing protein n=1 Tax=Seminavis robusta TaxID=568900 RepID=A0A9N8DM26_9STRA|nr:expressed unknown protein [Seminavis robusta]|eukprot:Sro154_g070140.1 n/a (826) ;mRNA; f:77893-80370
MKNGHRKNGSSSRTTTTTSIRRNSDSASVSSLSEFHSARSGDSLSRFPYHHHHHEGSKGSGRSQRRGAPQRTRSRSLDIVGGDDDDSMEFNNDNSDNNNSPYHNSGTEGRHVRRGRRNTNNSSLASSAASMELDESAASVLMLQESSTFPELLQGDELQQASGWNFAMEHRIFLKAVLELLAQRDKVATEVGMNDPNVLKSGPLKKASHLMRGIWKVKYIEIRRGMFSYYEDASNRNANESSNLLRKNIPLEANACHCRAVRLHQKAWNITPRGAIFELAITGRPKRLWMANSREERQAWIQAIHDAMVGGSVTRGGNINQKTQESKMSPYKEDIKKYQKVQGMLRNAKTKEDYVIALRTIFRHDLNVPVKIIIEQTEQESKPNSDVKGAFHEGDVKFGVDQLYKDLLRDTLKINSELYNGNSGHAPERITGDLARRILLCGRRDDDTTTASKYDMSESQALAYARDVLLSGNRTRSGGDAYFCVDTLCKNEELVVLVPSSMEAEPVSITVSRDDDDDAIGNDLHSKSGWLRTRRRTRNAWVKAYFVLSEGTLSFYEHALPRPHGLQGQLAISEATMSVAREEQKGNGFVLTIVAKDKVERQLLFESEERLLVWAYALECVAKSKGGAAPATLTKAMKGVMARMPRVSIVGVVGANPIAINPNHPRSAGNFAEDTAMEGASLAEAALKEHVANLGLDFKDLGSRLAAFANQSSPTVKVAIEAGTVYKVCTLDPEGVESKDTWAIIEATFLQDFRVSGGPNGRIIRGQETVRIDVSRCSAPASLPSVRRMSTEEPTTGRQLPIPKLLRTFSDDVEYRGSKSRARNT